MLSAQNRGVKKRLDVLLVERGLAESRAQAQALVIAGLVPGFEKPGTQVADDADLIVERPPPYVSRAGHKLANALDAFGIDVTGLDCCDVGASTGGFTDVLLQRGAARVVGVDVGHGQLDRRLAADSRVAAREGINARHLDARDLPVGRFDLIVADLSFISLALVLPALAPLAAGDLLLLVKPQFELQPKDIGKGGIVKDAAAYVEVERKLREACEASGLAVVDWFESAITGGDGNREFFLRARSRP